MKKKIVIICLGILYVVFLSAPGVFASSVSPTVITHTQDQIRNYIQNGECPLNDIYLDSGYEIEPVQSAPYAMGQLSSTPLEDSLAALNNIRYIAGLNPVTLDSEYNEYAQGAAFICSVNKKLAHVGHKQPDGMTDEMFEKCSKGAASTNLGWGYESVPDSIIYGWSNDSDSGNIDRLGHRRWVLNPSMGKTGFGYVDRYSAMYAFDRSGSSDQTMVAWPAQQMPIEYIKEGIRSKSNDTYAWSLSTGSEETIGNVSVTLTRKDDGKTWSFSQGSADGYFNVNNNGYGQKGCIIFCPDDVCYKANDKFHVQINGTTSGTVEYDVELFSLTYFDQEVEHVLELIEALPTNITLKDEKAVEDAIQALDGLNREQKYAFDEYDENHDMRGTRGDKLFNAKYKISCLKAKAKKGSLTKVKALKGKKAKLTWKKSACSGYEIWYSTSSSFERNVKTKEITSASTSKSTLKNLKKGKTYYFKIRPFTYITSGSIWATVDGEWSKVKKVKIRK